MFAAGDGYIVLPDTSRDETVNMALPGRGAIPLGELEQNADYRALTNLVRDDQCREFRRGVETTRTLCFGDADAEEIAGRLENLHTACIGTFAQFSAFIERAQAALP